MQRNGRTVRAVLLDIDGTLIDSNGSHAAGWVDAFADAGREVPHGEVRAMIGMGGERILDYYGIEPESDEGKRLRSEAVRYFKERYLPRIQAFPGVRPLLERMRADGLQLVVATSAGGDLLEGLLERAGVGDLIDAATTASEVEESKPAPDIVHAAMKKCTCGPDEVVMLGDTPYDVEAARRAGVPVVAVLCGGWDSESLKGADAIYESPEDLLARYEESMFAAGGGSS
jgi:HAD superfamily hydrolase (TIGR01549 family)